MREDLVASAVRFLHDAKVQDATLAKKLQFLESKGLTSDEINAAVERAGSSGRTALLSASSLQASSLQPSTLQPTWSWRNYLASLLAAGGLSYAAYALAVNYLPSSAQLKASEDAFSRLLEETRASVDSANIETSRIIDETKKQLNVLALKLAALGEAIDVIKANESCRELEIKRITEDAEGLKERMPKIVEQSKASQIVLLNELQNDVRSLKGFLSTTTLRQSTLSTKSSEEALPHNDTVDNDHTSSHLSMDTLPTPPIPLGAPKLPAWQRKPVNNNSNEPEPLTLHSSDTHEDTTTTEQSLQNPSSVNEETLVTESGQDDVSPPLPSVSGQSVSPKTSPTPGVTTNKKKKKKSKANEHHSDHSAPDM